MQQLKGRGHMAKDPSSSSSASLTNLYTHLQALIKKWVYDKPEVDNKLSNKLDKAQTSYKGKNVIVDSSSGNITFEDKNNHTHSQYLTEHQDISGKEDNSNKVTSLDSFSTDTEYPSAKAVYDEIWTDLYGTILNDYVPNNSLGSVAFSNDYLIYYKQMVILYLVEIMMTLIISRPFQQYLLMCLLSIMIVDI